MPTTATPTATKTRTLRLTQTAGGPALVIREQAGDGPVKVEAYYLLPVAERRGLPPDQGRHGHLRCDP